MMIFGIPESVIVVFAGMTVVAVAVMVAFGYAASRSDGASDTDENEDLGSETSGTDTTPTPDTGVELTDLKHVGEEKATTLREAGYESVADVAEADRDALTEVDGIGSSRGGRIAESADALLEQQSDANTEGDGEPSVAEDADEGERPRAVVSFDPDTEGMDREGSSDDAERGGLRLRTILSTVFGTRDTDVDSDVSSAVEQDDSTEEGETDADSPLSNAVTQVEDGEAEDGDAESSVESDQSAVARAKALTAAASHEVCGRVRMLLDRRVVDLRAYGVVGDWENLRVSVEDEDSVNRDLLTQIVDLGETQVEVESPDESADAPETALVSDGGLPDTFHVRFSHENTVQLEDVAERGRPEAIRSVTLLRRVLRRKSSGTVVRRFASEEEGSNVTVE